MNERRPLPESIQHRADVDALLAATTNYEDRLPRDPLRKALDLGRVESLLDSIGSPQLGPRTAHVAGSKGKGSTARMIAAGLRHAARPGQGRARSGVGGPRSARGPVGLYTSPHLQDLAERIEVDGRPVTEAVLARAAAAVLPHVRALQDRPEAPTFFELFTAMAWHAFREAGCRDVVLETGLGGRLDATNLCSPAVTVVTSIELEHTRLLGDTVEAIAAEKAGILKPGVPAVACVHGPAAAVIAARAGEIGAPLWLLDRDFAVVTADSGPGPLLELVLRTPDGDREQARLPFAGRHQAENAVAAWLALRRLGVPRDVAWQGIAQADLPGLMETVAEGPTVLIDGAHTARSAQAARASLAACWPGRQHVLLLAMLEEKEVSEVAAPLLRGAAGVVTTQVQSPRAIPAAELAAEVRSVSGGHLEVSVEVRPAEALERARRIAGSEGLILCAGSIYLAGEIRTLTNGRDPR